MKQNSKEWEGKSRGGTFGYRFFIFLIRFFGVKAAYIFLSFVVIYFIPFSAKATRSVWNYNRNILKYSRLKSVIKLYYHYYTFGQTIIDKVAINNGMGDRYKFEFDNYDNFLDILDKGAAIIIGGHIGNWEIGSQFFGKYADRLNLVTYDAEHQGIKEILQAQGVKHKVILINEKSIEFLLGIKIALDKKEYVCFLGDRYLDKSNAMPIDFMGKKALFPSGPTLIASKFSVPVVFYFSMREKGMRYRFIFKIIDKKLTQEELLKIYISEFEKVVKKYPQQWFNFYNVWSVE